MASPNIHSYNRRNSLALPYLIPQKHGHKFPHHHSHHLVVPHTPSKLSTLVPTLLRGFVSRRISEGETGRLKEQLKCEMCGKGYKHILSLAKHLWEHTPEWNMTKKLLLSKHQQVQLLEAALILVNMNGPDDIEFASSPTPETLHFTNSFDLLRNYAVESHDNLGTSRSYLISEYPPSLIPSTYSPMPGYVGGYLDVPKKKSMSPEPEEQTRLVSPEHEDESDDEILGKME